MPTNPPAFLYGTAWKEERTAGLTELAVRTGFRAIDTANQRKHYFEAGVGEGLAATYAAGVATHGDLFLQTKFTYQQGQDDRLPYDPAASLSDQVAQSMASSLAHLGTSYVDSYVLHGPASGYEWSEEDAEVWRAMGRERDAGRTRALGVSNVSSGQLEAMAATGSELPAFVQNNRALLQHPPVVSIAQRESATPAQVIFRFASLIGMLPMTGTSDAKHMRQDLASAELTLTREEVQLIESIAG